MSNKEQLAKYKENLLQAISLKGGIECRIIDQQMILSVMDAAYELGQKAGSEEAFRSLEA